MCKTVQLFKHLCVTPVGRNTSTITMAYAALPVLILHFLIMREDVWVRKRQTDGQKVCKLFIFLQTKIWGSLTVYMPEQPSKGYLKLLWRDVGWPLVGYCHLFYLKRCSLQWMKTEFHHELLLSLHDLSRHMITGLDTVYAHKKNHTF